MALDPPVLISIPADPRYFRPVRLAVGALAAMVGFHVEAIEDLRIAVDEISSSLIEVADGTELRFEVRLEEPSGLRIEAMATRGPVEPDRERFEFSQRILAVIADDHGFDFEGPIARGWLVRSIT